MEATQSSTSPQRVEHGKALLQLARRSIEHGLDTGKPVPVMLQDFHSDLQRPGAAFVTLHKQQQLRGCIGNLNACQPLVKDVADNAFNAAFTDPRFKPVTALELAELHVEISVLTPYEPVDVASETDLLEVLQPHKDGIVLEEGYHRSTFLPAVWDQLPDKQEFLQHLKLKAGLPADYWSHTLKIYRYSTICYAE